MKTRAAYMSTETPWQFALRDVELPDEPPKNHALVRIEASSICGSDLIWAEYGAPWGSGWMPFGHEFAGVVERVGEDADGLEVGDKVVFESGSFCGICDVCRDGRVDLCRNAPISTDMRAMGFSDFMLAHAKTLVKYDGLEPEAACLVEPAGVALDLVKTADIALGDRVCIVGPGPIALTALALIMHRGAAEVVCIGLPHDTTRLKIAAELGATTLAHEGPLTDLGDFANHFEHVLVTAPTRVIPDALGFLRYGGCLSFIGLAHGNPNITFNAEDFHFRKLQLRASFASPALYFPSVIRLMKAGVIPAEKLISHRYKLDEIEQAMLTCRDDKENVVKVVVSP